MAEFEEEVIKIYNTFYKLDMILELIRKSEYTGCFNSDFKKESFLENLLYILCNNYTVSPYLFYRRENEERLSLSELLGIQTDIVGLNRLIIMDKTSNHSGLEIGDIIIKVNGQSPIAVSTYSGLKKLNLEILRYCAIQKKYTDEKINIKIDSINVKKGINQVEVSNGYFNIVNFNNVIGLSDLISKPDQSIILDLRHNTGGNLEDAINFLEYFLGANKPICFVEKNHTLLQIVTRRNKRKVKDFKNITILTSELTASSAEIVVSALQEYFEVVIIGNSKKTFGKEYIQDYYTLDDETSFAIPTARIYTLKKIPMDRNTIQIDQIMSDHEISNSLIDKDNFK